MECVVECNSSLKNIVTQNLERCMLEGGNYFLSNLKIKAEAGIDSSWGRAK